MQKVRIRVATVGEPSSDDWAILDRTECARAERRADPRPFVAVHAALRRLVATELDVPASSLRLSRRCRTCGSERHGKPWLLDHLRVYTSISYTAEVILVGVTTTGELGLDIEQFSATDFDGFEATTLADMERLALVDMTGSDLLRARATMWARKEAILKATGHGLVVDPTSLVVSGPGEPAKLTRWLADLPEPRHVTLGDLHLPESSHAGAFAVLAPGPVEIDYT